MEWKNEPRETSKEIIEKALKRTRRKGVAKLLPALEASGFYTAPASGSYHCSCEGGLAIHSINVMNTALRLAKWKDDKITKEMRNSIIIASLLHDIGKMGDYNKPMYVENILKTGRSEAKPYKRNAELLPMDHATRSIKLATKYIELTEDEEYAIRYHDGLYEPANYGVKGNETELYIIIHTADLIASHLLEV